MKFDKDLAFETLNDLLRAANGRVSVQRMPKSKLWRVTLTTNGQLSRAFWTPKPVEALSVIASVLHAETKEIILHA